jgi:hypothetical protein
MNKTFIFPDIIIMHKIPMPQKHEDNLLEVQEI